MNLKNHKCNKKFIKKQKINTIFLTTIWIQQ